MNNAVLYINGLGDGEWHYRQRMLAKDLESYGYELEHSHLNWLSNKSFQEHLEETTEKAESILRNQGKLAIVGSSAGGSMAMNVFKELDSENAIAVNMCGQLALAWVLAQGDDIVPIPGTRHTNYLQENIGAVGVTLTSEDLQRLDEAAPKGATAGERYPDMSTINR